MILIHSFKEWKQIKEDLENRQKKLLKNDIDNIFLNTKIVIILKLKSFQKLMAF